MRNYLLPAAFVESAKGIMQNFSETAVAATSVGGVPYGVSGTLGRSLLSQNVREHRKEDRYRVAWKVAIAVEGQGVHDGRIRDISLHGAAILNVRNLKPESYVTLCIHMPSLVCIGVPKILIVHGITSYSVHDASNLCFRIGVAFVEFELPSDRACLEERLKNHCSNAW